MIPFLNIGCGGRIHKDWVNIDKCPVNLFVQQCDVERGLPFLDNQFDVVYHSHVLEHFEMMVAGSFVKECLRVLKPGGILRVVVPDLEQIVLAYLQTLQGIDDGDSSAHDDYDWMMLEMYDQVVRNSSGGKMASFFKRDFIPNKKFVIDRCGIEVERLMKRFEETKRGKQLSAFVVDKDKPSFFLLQSNKIIVNIREKILKILLGNEYQSLKIGRFRCSGENHQWMYDRISLHSILRECGFIDIVQRGADTSYVEDWTMYNLDTEPDGTIYKPDSLYMEAVKY